MFDWPRFLTAQGIPYVTKGPSTTKDNVAIRCPWCGSADPSEHLSISLRGEGYRCFRNPRAHAGRSRSRLIRELLHCSIEEARRLAGEEATPTPMDGDFPAQLERLLGVEERQVPRPTYLDFPPEIKPLGGSLLAFPFWKYLSDRGYSDEQVAWLIKTYDLRYAVKGRYRYRIIIPIESIDGRLVSWTARSINPKEELRYDTLSSRPGEGPVALASAKSLLLGMPQLVRCPNPEVLVLVEGPFDAFRITALGHQLGVYSTCLFGLEATGSQVLLLERVARRFRRFILLLDPDADLVAFRIREQLQPLAVEVERLPPGEEDPGALSEEGAEKIMRRWLAFNRNRAYIVP